jgi:hypothetical protein
MRLEELLWSEWRPFELQEIQKLDEEQGVYAIRCHSGPVARVSGSSDILYIGSSGSVRCRLEQLRGATATSRERGAQPDLPALESRGLKLEFSCAKLEGDVGKPGPQLVERMLLEGYKLAHGEFPPANRAIPGGATLL